MAFASNYDCNFHCSHCFVRKFQSENRRKLSTNEKIAVLQEARKAGVVAMSFVGGEVAISPEFTTLLRHGNTAGLYVNMFSNGFDLPFEKLIEFASLGVDEVFISIDFGNEAEHDSQRNQPGSYRKCFTALENVIKAGLNPAISTTVCRGSTKTEGFKSLVEFAIRHRITLVFSPIIPYGARQGLTDNLCDEDDFRTMEALHRKYSFLTRDNFENLGHYGCPAAKNTVAINEYGDVMPCSFLHFSFGNILTEPLSHIRQRMLKIPELKMWEKKCLGAEDREFIHRHMQTFESSERYPVPAEKLFGAEFGHDITPPARQSPGKDARSCPVCQSRDSEFYASGRELQHADGTADLFIFVRCLNCKTVYLDPCLADNGREETSSASQAEAKGLTEATDPPLISSKLKQIVSKWAGLPADIMKLQQTLCGFSMPREPRVLIIGWGVEQIFGRFRQNWNQPIELTGIDMNADPSATARPSALHVIHAKIDTIKLEPEYYDMIYGYHILDQVRDPLALIGKISNALKHNGVFVCDTPNLDSVDGRLFARSGYWGGYHFQWNFTAFTPETFTRLVAPSDLKVEKIIYRYMPIYWIWTLHAWTAARFGKKMADRLLPLNITDRDSFGSSVLKRAFTALEAGFYFISRRTSMMSVCMRKTQKASGSAT